MTQNPTPRRRFRLTLRVLFLLIAVLGCVMGWVVMMVNNYRQEWRAVDYLNQEHNALMGHSVWDAGHGKLPALDVSQLPWRIHRPHRIVSISSKAVDESFWKALADVKHLEHLALSDCELKTTGDEFSRFGSLRHLTLPNTPLASHDIQAIGSTRALESLDLNNVSDGSERIAPYLKDMPNLTSLRLRHSTISASAFRDICQVRSLRYLDLNGATVDWNEAHLLANLENLEALNLRESNVSDEDLVPLAALPGLKSLDLGQTNITDKGIANLANCRALENLRIDGTQITDDSMRHLTGLPMLESLNLSDTGVTSLSLDILALRNASKRVYVHIEGTVITEAERDRFIENTRY